LGLVDAGLRLGIPVLAPSSCQLDCRHRGTSPGWVMDTADGLAVQNPQRLQVMADSARCIWGNSRSVLIKTAALTDLDSYRWLALMAASGWGTLGQWRSHSIATSDHLQRRISQSRNSFPRCFAGTAVDAGLERFKFCWTYYMRVLRGDGCGWGTIAVLWCLV